MASEKLFVDKVVKDLSVYFHIQREVFGTHFSGKRIRIDLIISPINKSDWLNKNVVFGVEFKNPSTQTDCRNDTALIKQSIDYRHTNFDNYGYIPIIACPGFINSFSVNPHEFSKAAYPFVSRLLCKLNCGELIHTKYYGWYIKFAGDHPVWSEKYGVMTAGKNWKFNTSFGS